MALIKGCATDARCRFMKRPHNEFAGREVLYSGVTVFAFFFQRRYKLGHKRSLIKHEKGEFYTTLGPR